MGSQFTHPDPGGIPADSGTGVIHAHADYISGGHVIANQDANKVLAGPASGAAAAPTFRALAGNDLPAVTAWGDGDIAGDNFGPTADNIILYGMMLPVRVTVSHFYYYSPNGAASSSWCMGIYDSSGNLMVTTGTQSYTLTGGGNSTIATSSTVTLVPGRYYTAITATIDYLTIFKRSASIYVQFCNGQSVSGGGASLPSTITPPSDAWVYGSRLLIGLYS